MWYRVGAGEKKEIENNKNTNDESKFPFRMEYTGLRGIPVTINCDMNVVITKLFRTINKRVTCVKGIKSSQR